MVKNKEKKIAEDQPAPKSKKKVKNPATIRHLFTLLAAVVLFSIVFILLPIPTKNPPENALKTAWHALETNDTNTFKSVVDMQQFIQSLIEQVVTYEQADETTTAPLQQIRKMMHQGMIGVFRKDLAKMYSMQLENLVDTGNLEQNQGGLLWQLWQHTGARPQDYTGLKVLDSNETNALVTVNFSRSDLGNADLSLNFLLEKVGTDPNTGWMITDVPNLANFLSNIKTKQSEMLVDLNKPIKKKLEDIMSFIDIQKSPGIDSNSTGVMWRLAYRNTGGRDISKFTATLHIYNADDVLLHEEHLEDHDYLAAGATAEKAWPMPLTPANSADNEILNGSLRTLRTEIKIVSVEFTDGERLELLTKLPKHNAIPLEGPAQ